MVADAAGCKIVKPEKSASAPVERPQSAINTEKKKKLQPKFDKIKQKVDTAKEKA